jgi:hypothetical protein
VKDPAGRGEAIGRLDLVLIVGLGLALRLPLLLSYPAVHGGDSVARLAHSDTLVLAYQLPLPQALVALARALDPDPFWTRLVFVAIGALVPAALATAAALTAGPPAGRLAGLLASLHPLLAYYSLVPYQEGPFLLLLLLAAVSLLRSRNVAAGIWLGLACLCRYEAWIAAALVLVRRWTMAGATTVQRLRDLSLFGWAPLLWVAYWGGVSPAGTYVLDLDAEAARWTRAAFLAGKLREYSGHLLVVLGALGALVAVRRRPRGWGRAAAYTFVVLAVVVLAGHEAPPGSGRVSERLAHVPAVALCALAGLALAAALSGRGPAVVSNGLRLVVVALVAWNGLVWARRTAALVAEANRDPSLRLALEIARAVDARLPPHGRVAVVGPPVPAEAIEDYVRKVARAGGDAARARREARRLALRSADADRIAAHLPRPPRTVVDGDATDADLLVVFDDAPESGRRRRGPVLLRFMAGPRSASLHDPRR